MAFWENILRTISLKLVYEEAGSWVATAGLKLAVCLGWDDLDL